jgi:hypothetical protein
MAGEEIVHYRAIMEARIQKEAEKILMLRNYSRSFPPVHFY